MYMYIPVSTFLCDSGEDNGHKETHRLRIRRELVAFDERAHLANITLTVCREERVKVRTCHWIPTHLHCTNKS